MQQKVVVEKLQQTTPSCNITIFYITGTTTSIVFQLNSDVYIHRFGALTVLARGGVIGYFFHFKQRKDYVSYVVCGEAMIKTEQLKPSFNKTVVEETSTKMSNFD